jgi:hypothetical protein
MKEKEGVGHIILQPRELMLQSPGHAPGGQSGGGPPEPQHKNQDQGDQGQEVIDKGEVRKYLPGYLKKEASQDDDEKDAGQS